MGHRIPAFKVQFKKDSAHGKGEWIVARNAVEAKEQVEEKFKIPSEDYELHQDEDVLDTWFSSSLLPLPTLVRARIMSVCLSQTKHKRRIGMASKEYR